MKKFLRIICFALALVMVMPILFACGKTPGDKESEESSTEASKPKVTLDLTENGKFKYKIVRASAASGRTKKSALRLKNAIQEKIGSNVTIAEDFLLGDAKPEEFEILLGMTNREESSKAAKGLKYNDYRVTVENKKIAISALNDDALEKAVEDFIAFIDSQDKNLKFSTTDEIIMNSKYDVENITFEGESLDGYKIVLPIASSPTMKVYAEMLQKEIAGLSGIYMPIVLDNGQESEKEILFGDTTRRESSALDTASLGKYGYAMAKENKKFVIKTKDMDFTFVKLTLDLLEQAKKGNIACSSGELAPNDKVLMNAFCFTDVHNNFAMLEPPYVVRKNVPKVIDNLIEEYGKLDVAFVGGDLMSDYPGWCTSGHLPYKYYKEYRELLIETFARLTKDGKVLYTAGNHDYAQGELSKDGPGKGGSYNSYDFYFDGPMDKTFGVLSDEDKFVKIGEHTGVEYLISFYYEIDGIGYCGLSPDPDMIWSGQGCGFTEESLRWLDERLDKADPYGDKVIFFNCHYVIKNRYPDGNGMYVDGDKYVEDKLVPVLNGHKNLFHLFGHAESWLNTGYTNTGIFHFNLSGKLVDLKTEKETESTQLIGYGSRGFNSINMGHIRPMQGSYPKWFGRDTVLGYGGYSYKNRQPSTGTPKVAQGMYIEVYEDRVVFLFKHCGSIPGWQYTDKIEPYTVYRYK